MVRSSSADATGNQQLPIDEVPSQQQQATAEALNGNLSSATPLGVMLVSKDESAERVLFMYPFQPRLPLFGGNSGGPETATSTTSTTVGGGGVRAKSKTPVGNETKQIGNNSESGQTEELEGPIGLPVKMLAPLLVAKGTNDNGAPFEIKVDNVRFAGFPWRITDCVHSLAVVFILRGCADPHIVDAFQRLSKKIAIAINTEQQRCNYLRDQICLMQPAHDEYEALPDELKKSRCPYEAILEKSGLAKHLRDIFEDVCEYGMVDVFVDDCIEVGFCVEPKALSHAGLAPRSSAEVEAMMRHIRPYHGLLFLDESIPSPDSNPFVRRFLDEYEPSRSIEEMGHLSGLPLGQVLQIVRHYLLWARAMLIYPICTTNVYANAPKLAQNFRTLEAQFNERFGTDFTMAEVLEAFSPPCSLGSFLQDSAIYAGQSAMHMSMMVFLLQNQLLVQLHTFFFLLPPPSNQVQQQQRHQSPPQLMATTTTAMPTAQPSNINGSEMPAASSVENVQPQLSARIRTAVSASRELRAELRAHLLAVCARAIHAVGVPEPEVFWLVSTFLTFVPLLDGRHHMEDIIYRTHLDRSTVMRVLDTFSDVVCPFYCQDIVTEDD